MLVKYKDVKDYLDILNFNLTPYGQYNLCSDAFWELQNRNCVDCPFGGEELACRLLESDNPHLKTLVKTIKAKHPEFFI